MHIWLYWKLFIWLIFVTSEVSFLNFCGIAPYVDCHICESMAQCHMMMSSNGNISALLVLWAGNWPVTGEFPSQRPVTRSLDVYFDLRLNKWLSKQSRCWWFETPSCSLWCHCNESNKSIFCYRTTIIKIQDCLIFIMGIPILVRQHLYTEMAPHVCETEHLTLKVFIKFTNLALFHLVKWQQQL